MGFLDGRVAIVTGGGRGLGRAHALALAAAGAAVVVNDVGADFGGTGAGNAAPAEDVADSIRQAGGRAVADATDIADWDAVAAMTAKAIEVFGRLDIVVNNAAIARFGTIDAIAREDWERTIAVNLTGTGALCHWAAAHWRRAGPEAGRRIVNTTSGVGLIPQPNNAMYAAAKAGIAALTVACAIELAELGVRVNAVAPVARSRISEFVAGPLMKPVATGFDRMSPDHAATLVAHLASPACVHTGRVFGVIGDEITIYDGWTVERQVGNAVTAWSQDGLADALRGFPAQQEGRMQTGGGVVPCRIPADGVIAAVTAVEKA